jgi:hypothetical protein
VAGERRDGGDYHQRPVVVLTDGDRGFGHGNAEEHAGDDRHRAPQFVLAHDQAAQQTDEDRGDSSENDAHRGRVASPAMTNGPGTSSSPTASGSRDDWITQLLDKLDEAIEFVRVKTTEPLAKVARYLVYFALFAVAGMAFLVLLLITLVRLVAIIPGEMWTGYAGLAALFTVAGVFFWRKALRATR